ncbi:MAG: D-alanyl-D-alanine carboxypeptidase/D-alanyl-D-alanine-endopeptidase [Tannerellaceae bacterium]|nr:D-alanyl-D-alanine carboxypeptidase/D-alanyl-D-alanine-endopeptidase [Tannerellaceae bacterium]
MKKKILYTLCLLCIVDCLSAQVPQPVKQFLAAPELQGASFAFQVKDVETGKVKYSYDAERKMIPASILKLVTTATALELLGPDYRFSTVIEYDGKIVSGVLEGNLYIRGSGDPTLGTAHVVSGPRNDFEKKNTFVREWTEAIQAAGIKKITGSIIADEQVFDAEPSSYKWFLEDIGSYYGAGSFGLNVFDNLYSLYLHAGAPGSTPVIRKSEPDVSFIRFQNNLKATAGGMDSTLIIGLPFSTERYLYGTIPANREEYVLRGDLPDPPLFLARYFSSYLTEAGIEVTGQPACYYQLRRDGKWQRSNRRELVTTRSLPLKDIILIVNNVSHNLYADALLKTIGLQYKAGKNENINSFNRGVRVIEAFWKERGFDLSEIWMTDGSGLSPANKVTAGFLSDILCYMVQEAVHREDFTRSLPQVGIDGSVRNFLKGSTLEGRARLKSGGMSRIRCYAGCITKDNKQYAVTVMVNNYSGEVRAINRLLEKMLIALF